MLLVSRAYFVTKLDIAWVPIPLRVDTFLISAACELVPLWDTNAAMHICAVSFLDAFERKLITDCIHGLTCNTRHLSLCHILLWLSLLYLGHDANMSACTIAEIAVYGSILVQSYLRVTSCPVVIWVLRAYFVSCAIWVRPHTTAYTLTPISILTWYVHGDCHITRMGTYSI